MTGPELRAICDGCGLKHHWLAAKFDRAPGTWSKYLSGEMPVPAAIASKMLALQSAFELVFRNPTN